MSICNYFYSFLKFFSNITLYIFSSLGALTYILTHTGACCFKTYLPLILGRYNISYLPCIWGRYVSKRTILCNRPLYSLWFTQLRRAMSDFAYTVSIDSETGTFFSRLTARTFRKRWIEFASHISRVPNGLFKKIDAPSDRTTHDSMWIPNPFEPAPPSSIAKHAVKRRA